MSKRERERERERQRGKERSGPQSSAAQLELSTPGGKMSFARERGRERGREMRRRMVA